MKTKKIIPWPESYIKDGETADQFMARCKAALAEAGAGAEFESASEDVTDQRLAETEVTYVHLANKLNTRR